ncbi:ATP-binding cassette domain-containing protein [Rhizosphaericola mali]|uniref:ATP-binding cassette domain-containing protein n=1 Tax=Rhizosphaericola mali TaxID=2545455 RepID=A0A5P2G5T4_9BACT|nr:ATP-binding cassette domain-containing protein [Rhizosphaericola mali]QES90607.1 ATP-binding cassette domain-containing protein [Rhizosphaericola mali]
MSIIVEHLVKKYGTQTAVNDVSFQLKKGEVVGFLGPNGAGKSTTLKMITGYLQPDSGNVQVAGVDMLQNPIAAKRKIGYLPEANPLYLDMYVKEYLNFIAKVHQLDNIPNRIDQVVELVGLGPEKGKKLQQLSKGYKQRAGLAAALIHEPEVLILDEPTSGLDPNQIVEIRNVIKEQGKNKTVLFSSHILQEVEAVCSRILILNKGVLKTDQSIIEKMESADTQALIKISFKEIIEPQWLLRLPSVTTAEKDKKNVWHITTADLDVTRKELMALALNENFTIISMETGSLDLENTFREMTK